MTALAVFVIAIPVFSLVRAFAIQLGWTWFLVRAFPALPHSISLVTALGLSLLASLLFTSWSGADADVEATEGKSATERAVTSTIRGVAFYGTYFIAALIVHALA